MCYAFTDVSLHQHYENYKRFKLHSVGPVVIYCYSNFCL